MNTMFKKAFLGCLLITTCLLLQIYGFAQANYANNEELEFIIQVSANPEEGGTVDGGGTYSLGDTVTLHATPNVGYTFMNWTSNSVVVSVNESLPITVTGNASYIAHFAHSASGFMISASANPAEGGTVTGSGMYSDGLTVTLTATANEGYKFVNWTENGVIQWMENLYEFVVDRNRTIIANFEALPTFTISAMAGANGSITPQGDVVVVKGTDKAFTMTPESGGRIAKVLVDGIDIGPVETYTFINVNRDHSIFVSFSGTDVDEVHELDMNIYPNPAKEIVNIEGEGLKTVALYDLLGNCLRTLDYKTGNTLNVSDLPRNTYLLMLFTQDGRVEYQKLVLF